VDLDAGQRLVVEHEHGAGPLRVLGGFGTGVSTALRARAERLEAEGLRPLLVAHRDLVGLAVDILRRHGGRPGAVHLVPSPSVLAALVSRVAPDGVDRHEAATTVVAFQASFLGDEELRVHADAAGCLDAAEEVIATTAKHRAALGRDLVDEGGAVVEASLLLRDPEVLAAERARFDELLVDDFQLASFATNRLLSQLAGPGGPLVVGGNPEAAVSRDPLASAAHLDRFERRFGGTTVTLSEPHRLAARPPELRLVGDEGADVASSPWTGPEDLWIAAAEVEAFVGREGKLVVVADASAEAWPAPRPKPTWFDPELFHGPDVPDDAERDRRWRELERHRFLVATSRATQGTLLLARPPISPLVGELLR
jgi:hypothetical protein